MTHGDLRFFFKKIDLIVKNNGQVNLIVFSYNLITISNLMVYYRSSLHAYTSVYIIYYVVLYFIFFYIIQNPILDHSFFHGYYVRNFFFGLYHFLSYIDIYFFSSS